MLIVYMREKRLLSNVFARLDSQILVHKAMLHAKVRQCSFRFLGGCSDIRM